MNESIVTILAAGLSATVAILLFVLQHKNEQLKIIKEKVSEKKYEAYNEVLTIFFDVFKEIKEYKKFKPNELPNRIIDAKKLLIIYATDEILFKFFEWNVETEKPNNSYNLAVYLDLIVLIRKDMGHPKSTLTKEHVLRSICNSDKTYEELKDIILTKSNYIIE